MAVECPNCSTKNPDLWLPLYVHHDENRRLLKEPLSVLKFKSWTREEEIRQTEVYWMRCLNVECGETLVEVHHGRVLRVAHGRTLDNLKSWFAVPRKRISRPVDPLVKDPFRQDYLEAAAILEDSPRMAAVLLRRILAELLRNYAGRPEFKLDDQITAFVKDGKFPDYLKENLNHLREMGNFGAHEQTDKTTGEIIDISRDQAEWALTVIDDLFESFIVARERNAQQRKKVEEQIAKAGRKPLK